MSLEVVLGTKEDTFTAYSWAEKESWNPGIEDPQFAADNFHGHLYIGKIDGKAISSLLIVPHEPGRYGFAGVYICLPEYRQKGHGLATWKYAMADYQSRYGPNSALGLAAVLEQVPNYEKSGFINSGITDLRHAASVKTILTKYGREVKAQSDDGQTSLVPLSSISFEEFCAFDKGVFGVARNAHMLREWHQKGSAAISGGKIVGFGWIRKCVSGYRLNPLFAQDPEIANFILVNLAQKVSDENEEIYIDIPDCHQKAIDFAVNRYGFTQRFACVRMYAGTPPNTDNQRIYSMPCWEFSN